WEANHVWLVFVLVVLWTGFPPAFAAIASTLYIPLTGVALGVIARGAAFAFRKNVEALEQRRLFGAAFASSSVLTPFFLGTVAGGIASGRVPPGLARGDVLDSWVNPTSLLAGVLAVGICAYLAAVYLCADAVRADQHDLAEAFRRRALGTGLTVGAVALAGIAVLHADAPLLFAGLTGRALPVAAASAAAGLASLWLLITRRYRLVRITAALAVTAVLWAWAVAQYPLLLVPTLSIDNAAAGQPTLRAMLISLVAGAVVLVPSLGWLFWLFQQHPETATGQARNPHS
ncbi:MAG TPA: cytochrome d ubiquinol oxidase subunit II, partial [Pseudonocardiaceae bacterium]|nr:cytochrome d ubiquinol oxidase subunit II [Pseudonocardiaceae bacterium]